MFFCQIGSCTSRDSHMWRQNQADAITWGFFIRCPVFCLYWCLVILGYHGYPGGLRIFQWHVFRRVKNGPHDRKFFKNPSTPYDMEFNGIFENPIQWRTVFEVPRHYIYWIFKYICHWIPEFKIQKHRVHDHSLMFLKLLRLKVS